MIPIEINGHSFKGLINYLVTFKDGDFSAHQGLRRLVHTANMVEHKPKNSRDVIAVMAHYAREDVRRGLMELAQIRGRGGAINNRKPPVRHIVLAFPDGAMPEKDLIKVAVKGALSSLDTHNGRSLADHQYAVYLHQDTDHWHVHVVVNLIDHRTGRLADPYRSQQKLQKWAYEWCKAHGFDVCPDRQKKYERIEANKELARQDGRHYHDDGGYKNLRGDKPHIHQYKKRKDVLGLDGRSAFFNEKIVTLKLKSAQNYQRRSEEKKALYRWKMEHNGRIKTHFQPLLKEACALRENPLPFTIDAFQRAERHGFFKRERTAIGRMFNSAILALDSGSNGFWRRFFNYIFMGQDGRRIALFKNQYRRRKSSKRVLKVQQRKCIALEKLDRSYAEKLKLLKNGHYAEISKERLDWRDLNEVRFRQRVKEGAPSQKPYDQKYISSSLQHRGINYTAKKNNFQNFIKNDL